MAARRGFTLAEVLVAFALIAVLASVIVPTVYGRMQDGYEDAIVSEFDNLATAVAAYRQNVGKYPPKLSYLSALPSSIQSGGGPFDKCGNALSATAIANWHGPYVTRVIPYTSGAIGGSAYTFAFKDTVPDTLVSTTSPNGIIIRMVGPDLRTAQNLDQKIDGSNNPGTGALQYTGTARTDMIVSFIIPTAAGAC